MPDSGNEREFELGLERELMAERFSFFDRQVHEACGEPIVSSPMVDWSKSVDTTVERVVRNLRRDSGVWGPGYAVVAGFTPGSGIDIRRECHRELFEAVWHHLQPVAEVVGSVAIASTTTIDRSGAHDVSGIFGTFKRPHQDRSAYYFSMLYGPASGYDGGDVVIIDMARVLRERGGRFADFLEWSGERGAEKVVLQESRVAACMAAGGVNLGRLGAESILFVNNSPTGGVLHGALPIHDIDAHRFVRTIHRCSVKRSAPIRDEPGST